MKKILIIDDDPDIRVLLEGFLSKNGFETTSSGDGASALSIIKNHTYDLVISDFKLPDINGIELIQKAKIFCPDASYILITGYSDVKVAVNALKMGAYDYVTKPLYPDELLATVNKAIEENKTKNVDSRPSQKKRPVHEFVYGESQQSLTVRKHIDLIAPTDMSVIILGETGTGKEYVARRIHEKSARNGKPFVAVDCGALPKNLAGSELFGHVKGAFTGATSDKTGLFQQANEGTLFLDEIGNLSYEDQVKLLRVLQERKVRKIGDDKDIDIDIRVIVATNESLREVIKAGGFREDLYHRLNEFKIEIAPIRERKQDILIFSEYFLKISNHDLNKNIKSIHPKAADKLTTYYWHGNLRELRNVIKRAVLLAQGNEILPDHLPDEINNPHDNQEAQDTNITFQGGVPGTLKQVVEAAEKAAIERVLELTQRNKTKTATLLGVDRKTLYNKLSQYNIDL